MYCQAQSSLMAFDAGKGTIQLFLFQMRCHAMYMQHELDICSAALLILLPAWVSDPQASSCPIL